MPRSIAALLLLFCVTAGGLQAHELPQRVPIRMIAAVDGQRLQLMVRVPLEAMRDVNFPLSPEGYLLIDEAEPALAEAAGLWIVDGLQVYEGGSIRRASAVQTRLALPGDRAFRSLASAARHFISPPLPSNTHIYWRQAMLDVALSYPLSGVPGPGTLTMDIGLRHLGETTQVELLFIDADGESTELVLDGDARKLPLGPSWRRVAVSFLGDGLLHILAGIDHLLFLLCLVLPLRQLWPLVKTVTAFTVAHSITLAAASLDRVPTALWFPSLVEWIIALSIVYLAVENILRTRLRWRWATAFVFGLAHGFGFASALVESLQFAQGQQLLALAAFNLGVEAGQIAVVVALTALATLLLRRPESSRLAVIVISVFVAHTAWHWMSERFRTLEGYFF